MLTSYISAPSSPKRTIRNRTVTHRAVTHRAVATLPVILLGLVACSCTPQQMARWSMEELEVSRSCNLTDVALDFSQGGKRDLGSAFYQMSLASDRSSAQILNTATGCLDIVTTNTGPMEIDNDLRGLRLSDAGEAKGAEAFNAVYDACEARIELGELDAYKAAKEAELSDHTQKAAAGNVSEQTTVCDIYVHDMQLWMRLRTASHAYLYASIGETLIVEDILPE